MKKFMFCVFTAIVFASCGQKPSVFESGTPEEKWDIMREHFIVPGAPVGNERPLPNVLSEQEALLKAADAAIKEGALDPSYYAYQHNPALLTAKIETPILVSDAFSGVPDRYFLNAVDANGISLALVSVSSNRDADDASFVLGRSISWSNGSYSHLITKREAADIIQSQFPDSVVSEPMAIYNLRLGDDPQSHRVLFWYFEAGENSGTARSAADTGEGYIFEAYVGGGYSFTSARQAVRPVIDIGKFRSPHLAGYSMAKLDKPLNLVKRLDAARAAGGITFAPITYSTETVGFTPVPLR
jgi:hypothetical protein